MGTPCQRNPSQNLEHRGRAPSPEQCLQAADITKVLTHAFEEVHFNVEVPALRFLFGV